MRDRQEDTLGCSRITAWSRDDWSPKCLSWRFFAVTTFLAVAFSACGDGRGGDGAGPDAQVGEHDAAYFDDGGGDAHVAAPTRWLDLEGVVNARDVGGYPAGAADTLRWRVLFRGGDLSGLTQQGCDEFVALGVSTVIDLRMESAQSSSPPAPCVRQNAEVVSVAMPKLLPANEENYLALMGAAEGVLPTMFHALSEADAAPVYIHCVIGRDRASFAVALVMAAVGADRQVILEDFRLSNDVGIGVDDAHLEAVLDEIDNNGGILSYLDSLGVTTAHLDAVKAWVLE